MLEYGRSKNNGNGNRHSKLLLSSSYFKNESEKSQCISCNDEMNRVYIKNGHHHSFSPEIKGIGWVCLKCGIVDLDFKWYNPESISEVINRSEEYSINETSKSELEYWVRELERAKEENDHFTYFQAKTRVKELLG